MDALPSWKLTGHLIIITQIEIFMKYHTFLQKLLEPELHMIVNENLKTHSPLFHPKLGFKYQIITTNYIVSNIFNSFPILKPAYL